MKLDKRNKNTLRALLGESTSEVVNVVFRNGEKVTGTITNIFDGNRYSFHWNVINNISIWENGNRYLTVENEYDIMEASLFSYDERDLKSLDDKYKQTDRNAFELLYKIVRRRNDYVNLQDKTCDALYTNVFNDKLGRNIEYRVLGIIIINEKLYFAMVPVQLEDAVKEVYSKEDMLLKYENSQVLVQFFEWNHEDISQTYLFSELVKILYQHLDK